MVNKKMPLDRAEDLSGDTDEELRFLPYAHIWHYIENFVDIRRTDKKNGGK